MSKRGMTKVMTETRVDQTTGEVKEITTVAQTKYAAEPGYVKLYLEDITYLTKLPKGSEGILYGILKQMSYKQQIVLNKYIKEGIAEEAGITLKTVDNNISVFVNNGVLIRVGRGVYEVNTYIFGKGNWKDILKHRRGLKLEIEYAPDSGRVIQFKSSK